MRRERSVARGRSLLGLARGQGARRRLPFLPWKTGHMMRPLVVCCWRWCAARCRAGSVCFWEAGQSLDYQGFQGPGAGLRANKGRLILNCAHILHPGLTGMAFLPLSLPC